MRKCEQVTFSLWYCVMKYRSKHCLLWYSLPESRMSVRICCLGRCKVTDRVKTQAVFHNFDLVRDHLTHHLGHCRNEHGAWRRRFPGGQSSQQVRVRVNRLRVGVVDALQRYDAACHWPSRVLDARWLPTVDRLRLCCTRDVSKQPARSAATTTACSRHEFVHISFYFRSRASFL